MQKRFFQSLVLVSAVVFLSVFSVLAQQQVQRAPFDVTNYRMDVQLVPSESQLQATVDVTFTPQAETRTVAFELNGSLKIESVSRVGSTTTTTAPVTKGKTTTPASVAPQNQVTFVQDQVGVSDLGPSVRVDFGEPVAAKARR